MPSDDQNRRLMALRFRPHYDHIPDALIGQCLDGALGDFLSYTNRREDPGQGADSIIIELACAKLNLMGVEGSKKAKDGEIEREVEKGVHEMTMRKLDAWRRPMWPRGSRWSSPWPCPEGGAPS